MQAINCDSELMAHVCTFKSACCMCVSTVVELTHHLSMCPSVWIFCAPQFVWRCDNAEPREAACFSVVAPCSWPTLAEVN